MLTIIHTCPNLTALEVGILLGATCVWIYLIGVCAILVFGSVGCIGKRFVATFMFTHIWLLSCVWPQMCLQIL